VDLADRGPQRPLRIAEEVAEIVAEKEILVGAEAAHQAPPLQTTAVDQLLDSVEPLPVQPLGLGFQDFPPIHVVVAGDEEEVSQRHLRRKGPADGVEKRSGFAELLLDRLARRAAEVPEGGVSGEEDQIRSQVMIALQADQVLDQRLSDSPRVPAGAGPAGVEIREVQPGQRGHDGEIVS
jgi:hypothetical protein